MGFRWGFLSWDPSIRLPAMLLPPLLLLPVLWAESPAEEKQFRLRLEKQVTVQEGQCANVSCEFTCPPNKSREQDPIHGYWYKQREQFWSKIPVLVATNDPAQQVQKETQGRFHLLEDSRNHSCSLDIRDARREDTGTYYFRLQRGDIVINDYTDYLLSVNVTALTQKSHVQLPGTLQSGRPSNINCSAPWACPRGTPPTFSWMGVALPSQGTDSPVLSLTPGPQHHGTNLTCQVSFPGANVSTERTVQLSVAYAPQNLTIWMIRKEGSEPKALANGSALPVQEGQSLRLVCVVDSRPPANLSWVQGNLTVNSSASLSPVGAGGVGEHSQSLELELPSVHLDDHGPFLCRAQHPLGSQEVSLRLSVQNPPRLLDLSCSREDEGLHCSCTSSAQPAPSLRWWLGEQLLEGNSSDASVQVSFSRGGSWANSSLSLHGELNSNLSLSCEVLNAHGKWGISILLLPGWEAPSEEAQNPTSCGEPGARTGVILGATGGTGITALLALCLFFIVRRHGRNHEEGAAGSAPEGTSSGQEYVNGSWAVSTSDSSGASIPLREGAGAASQPTHDPQGEALDLQDQNSTVGPVYAVVKFRQ